MVNASNFSLKPVWFSSKWDNLTWKDFKDIDCPMQQTSLYPKFWYAWGQFKGLIKFWCIKFMLVSRISWWNHATFFILNGELTEKNYCYTWTAKAEWTAFLHWLLWTFHCSDVSMTSLVGEWICNGPCLLLFPWITFEWEFLKGLCIMIKRSSQTII